MAKKATAAIPEFRHYKTVALAELVPYDRNARTHSPEQVAQVAASIREFGFTNPLLIDEQNRIIAGHGRLAAATSLGMPAVPCIVVDGLTDDQRRALVLADNQLAANAGWDIDLLAEELRDLRDSGFDIDLVGFDTAFLNEILDPSPGQTDPDGAPALDPVAVSELGDVWTLGPHRVICGDSVQVETLTALLGSERVDVCWTDPPYNVSYGSNKQNLIDAGIVGNHRPILNDSMSDGDFRSFLHGAFGAAFGAMKPGAAIYVAHADNEGLNFRGAFTDVGFHLSGCVIWRKDSLVLGRADYQWIHEPILYGWKPGARHRWYGGRKNTTVVDLGDGSPFQDNGDGSYTLRVGDKILTVSGQATVTELVPSVINEPKPKRSTEHPTMKPVALIERMLKHSARPGDLVLDPFGGSGSTLMAAERLGMSARLIELDPCYVDVIVRRWQQYTGRDAVRADGSLFKAVENGRQG